MGEFEELRRHAAAGPRTSKSGSKAPLPKQPVSEADRLRASAISASLLNAQHWFDKGTVALELGHPLDWRTIAGEANSCLMQANRLLDGYERRAPEIVERVEEVTRAMDRYFIRQTPSIASNDAPTYQGVVAKLRKLDLALRWSFDLPYESSSRPHRAATKHDDEYSGRSLVAMLNLVTFEARTAMARIQAGADAKVYRPIVERSTAALQRDLAFAGSMFDAYRGSDKARIFTAKIAGASIELARLQRFIDGRQNNQDLRQRFAAVETSINSLRAAIHLGPLSELEVTTSNAQEHTKDSERASISTARDALDAGLKHLEEEIELGANRFFQFARLEDPPNAGSMWMELGKSLLVALLGNLAGVGIGKFLRGLAGADVATKIEPETLNRVPSDPRDHIGDAGEGLTSGIGSDTAQSWAGVIDEASTKADSKAEKIKDAVFFQESLLGGRRAIAAGVKLEVSRRTRDKNISAGEISALAVEAERQAVTAKERTYTSASRDFALFLAHRGLGVENRGGVDVSKIGGSQEYFFGTSLQRGGKREETDGIGRLTVQLDRMQPEIKNFEVAGMNSEVAKAILDGANRRVGRLGIPLEIELILPWSRSRPIIVVDERGHVRTSLFANELATSAPDHPVARSFATPEAAWASLKDSFIPEGVG